MEERSLDRNKLNASADIFMPNDGLLEVQVSPQKGTKYLLIPTFEVSSDSDSDFPKRKWPWGASCIWYATVNPATRDEYLLLKDVIRSCKSSDSIPYDMLERLKEFDPVKYSDSTRITRNFLAEELEELDASVRAENIPCAKVVRLNAKKVKTNSIAHTKVIAVSTFKLTASNTFRVQMSESSNSYVDLHFDSTGQYAGCAFLCGSDTYERTKFTDNYMSEDFDRGALKGILNGLTG
ncbi:MAG: hypothetical protein PHY80_01150, partial [Rickettsiales bacterium]|nr:hypothetical protein [Rickettsiales bacterium]